MLATVRPPCYFLLEKKNVCSRGCMAGAVILPARGAQVAGRYCITEDVMGLRIMIVDDALFMRTLLRGILEEEGWEIVAEATDGADAVIKYAEFRPDITTMDIVMPKKSGIEALAEITAMDTGAKVVMCSAMGQESLVEEARLAGAKGYIIKPFDGQRVKGVIKKVAGL